MGCSKELAELEHVTVKEAINPANQFVKFLPFRYAKEELFGEQKQISHAVAGHVKWGH